MSEYEVNEGRLAYVAGIIDSQGGIRSRFVGDTELPMVYVHGPNLPVLNLLADMTGTKVTVVRRGYSKAGCSIHCPEKHQHVVSTSGRWSVTGVKATVLLWNIRPYLMFQSEAATAALAVGMSSPFKMATPQKMADLGWSLPDFGVAA
jgi:hypothetical protein